MGRRVKREERLIEGVRRYSERFFTHFYLFFILGFLSVRMLYLDCIHLMLTFLSLCVFFPSPSLPGFLPSSGGCVNANQLWVAKKGETFFFVVVVVVFFTGRLRTKLIDRVAWKRQPSALLLCQRSLTTLSPRLPVNLKWRAVM